MEQKQKKRVLIITYYWPPSGGAGVQRWLKFVKYLPDYNWIPVVYTPENPEAPVVDESLESDINPETEIIKKPIWEPYSFYKRFTGKEKNQQINAGFLLEKKSNPILEKASVFIRGNFFIPDARKFWIRPSVRFLLKYIKENEIDTVISTGPPHSMHLIALKLKGKLNINWLADFRDPWSNIDFYKDLKLTSKSDRKHKRLENEVLTNADIVISVGNTLGKELKMLGAKNVKVITNGFDHDDIPKNKPSLDEKFSIIHLGSMNKDRNHVVFWEVLSELVQENPEFKEKLKIKLIGKVDHVVIDNIKNMGFYQYLQHDEYIEHDQVISELMKSNLLYLPINNTPNAKGIVTGKFFEYLASERPILTIGQKDSDIAQILNDTKAGDIFDFNNSVGIKDYLMRQFKNYQEKKSYLLNTGVDSFSRKSLTKKLSKLLDNLNNE